MLSIGGAALIDPALAEVLTVNLRTFGLRVRRYTQYRNPPILHRTEVFLAAEHPLRAKFARLTRLEDAMGLYADTSRIGTRDGWEAVWAAKGFRLSGHRLVRRSQVHQPRGTEGLGEALPPRKLS